MSKWFSHTLELSLLFLVTAPTEAWAANLSFGSDVPKVDESRYSSGESLSFGSSVPRASSPQSGSAFSSDPVGYSMGTPAPPSNHTSSPSNSGGFSMGTPVSGDSRGGIRDDGDNSRTGSTRSMEPTRLQPISDAKVLSPISLTEQSLKPVSTPLTPISSAVKLTPIKTSTNASKVYEHILPGTNHDLESQAFREGLNSVIEHATKYEKVYAPGSEDDYQLRQSSDRAFYNGVHDYYQDNEVEMIDRVIASGPLEMLVRESFGATSQTRLDPRLRSEYFSEVELNTAAVEYIDKQFREGNLELELPGANKVFGMQITKELSPVEKIGLQYSVKIRVPSSQYAEVTSELLGYEVGIESEQTTAAFFVDFDELGDAGIVVLPKDSQYTPEQQEIIMLHEITHAGNRAVFNHSRNRILEGNTNKLVEQAALVADAIVNQGVPHLTLEDGRKVELDFGISSLDEVTAYERTAEGYANVIEDLHNVTRAEAEEIAETLQNLQTVKEMKEIQEDYIKTFMGGK